MSIKIEMLRSFCTVAQTGSLAEAANRLGRTPSAVSMTLKQLEEHLGKKLFESERKNRLSALGEQVFELATLQLRQFDLTVQSIETSASAPQGLIRVVSVPSVAALAFPNAVAELSNRYPAMRLDLRDADTPQVIDALVQGQADIGIASGQHALNGMQTRVLFEDSFGVICAKEHPLAQQVDDPTLAQIRETGFLQNNLCGMIQTPAFHEILGESRITVPNTLSLMAMVQRGEWVTVLPNTVISLMPQSLAFRRVQGLADKRQVSLFLREKSRFFNISEELAKIIEENVQ